MKLKNEKEKKVDDYFNPAVDDKQRVCFEAGIKLGAIFHSLLAFPVINEKKTLEAMQKGFITSFKNQPYVKDLDIKIHPGGKEIDRKEGEFEYTMIKDHMIDVNLEMKYNDVSLLAVIKWVPELEYPLMYIKEIN
ncbi:MAG: dihydroneopterin aldolase family protein [Candidatus Hodarchaeota archaeon]